MDIRCPKCGEPWDHDELHELGSWIGDETVTYDEARKRFYRDGCVAFGERHNAETLGSEVAEAAGEIYGLLGDDVDGAASLLEDFFDV